MESLLTERVDSLRTFLSMMLSGLMSVCTIDNECRSKDSCQRDSIMDGDDGLASHSVRKLMKYISDAIALERLNSG